MTRLLCRKGSSAVRHEIRKMQLLTKYTGWLVTGDTSRKGVILREKSSRKYRIKICRLRLCFRENQL